MWESALRMKRATKNLNNNVDESERLWELCSFFPI